VAQNNSYVALDSAPKYVLLPGFGCTIASVVFLFLGVVVDVLVAVTRSSAAAAKPPATSEPPATLRSAAGSSPSHIAHYHVTSPLSVAARSGSMLQDQP
jgi:hypothetical protein